MPDTVLWSQHALAHDHPQRCARLLSHCADEGTEWEGTLPVYETGRTRTQVCLTFFNLGIRVRKQTQMTTKKLLKLWGFITLLRLLTYRDDTLEIPHP